MSSDLPMNDGSDAAGDRRLSARGAGPATGPALPADVLPPVAAAGPASSAAGRGAPRHVLSRELWRVLAAYRWRVAGAVVLLVLAKVAGVSVPLFLKRIVDTLSRPAMRCCASWARC